ncbi:hypothetical protein Ahy_A04g021434 isoform A [Arachis hypogaea]|uniref:Trafficking protein particle complex subunit n=1 Tax=Arachis hypogaea TaxID=3818 RepID=A0A445DKB0_ARAHY|nr:hypothetical protein Ahy_A04g021434 isoform A [Arachis hypogaea]
MIGVGKMKQYTNVLDKPLTKGKQEVSLSAFAFLFSELVQYNQTQVDNIGELERRLEDAGYAVGARVLELLCHRDKFRMTEIAIISETTGKQKGDTTVRNSLFCTQYSVESTIRKGCRKYLNLILEVHFDDLMWSLPPWDEYSITISAKSKDLVADSLEKGTEHEDEYMISEKELLVNRFISIPKDMGTFNCGAFVAGIVRGVLDGAGFPAVVTAHFVPVEGQQRPRTTILIKFAEEVLHREARLG